jgi:hypothetical protein
VTSRASRLAARYLVVVLALVLPARALAQSRLTGADLLGTVSDESGAGLVGVTLTVTNVDTRLVRTLATDTRGRFQAPALPPGTYQVKAELAGFGPQNREGVVLLLGQSAQIDFTLKLADAREEITVTADAPMVDSAQTAVGSVVREQQIQSLPINGRNFISFATITAGATVDRTPQQGATVTSGLTFSGQRARSNNIMVDGFDNNEAALGSVGATFSQEAVREFQVLASSYPAEFGKASGGVVNIVTKSGTNQLHGNAFVYFRDEALNAKEYFERYDRFGNPVDREKAPYSQYQWGGVLGGPVRKEKTFFFLSFERLDVTANNFVNIDPVAAGVLLSAGFPVELGNVPYDVRSTSAMVRLDHDFASDSHLMVRAAFSDTFNENIEPFGGIVARSRGAVQLRKDWSVAAAQTNVFGSAWVNEARFQFAYQDLDVNSLDPNCGGECGDDFNRGGPTLELPGIASVGRQRFTPNPRKYDRYQLMDTVTFLPGGHTLKAGFEFNYIDNEVFQLPLHFGGRYIFTALGPNPAIGLDRSISALEALQRGLPATYFQGYGDPNGPYTYKDLSLFVQDEWKLGTKLRIKPGLRYQRQFWPELSFDVSNVGGTRFAYDLPQDRDNIAPRIAVSYDPAGDGKTSIHGSYGIYHDNHIATIVGVAVAIDGRNQVRGRTVGLPASIPGWNAPGHQLPEPSTPYPSAVISIDPDLQNPWARHAAVGFDRALTADLALSVNGVYARGFHNIATLDYNPRVPALGAPTRRPNDVGGVPGTSTLVLQYTSYGETWYRGLVVSLNKRFSHNYQFLASYTLSDAEDNTTDFASGFPPEVLGFGRNPADPTGLPLGFDPYHDRGPSTQDQRHRFVLSGLYQLPAGIQFSAIFSAASGRPYSALAGADLNGDGDGGAFPADRARRNPSDAASSVGRNSETMPAQVILDARLSKRFKIGGGASVEAIAEAFNLLNRSNFSEVNNIFGRGAFPADPQRDSQGRVTYGTFEQALPPRQVQLALRVLF